MLTRLPPAPPLGGRLFFLVLLLRFSYHFRLRTMNQFQDSQSWWCGKRFALLAGEWKHRWIRDRCVEDLPSKMFVDLSGSRTGVLLLLLYVAALVKEELELKE